MLLHICFTHIWYVTYIYICDSCILLICVTCICCLSLSIYTYTYCEYVHVYTHSKYVFIYIIIHLNILLTPNMMRQHFVPKIASGCKQMGVSEYVLYFPEQNRMSLCGSELWYRDPFRVACMVDRSYWTFYYSFDWCFGDHVHLSSLEVWNQLITMESAALVASARFLLASWALR